MKRAVQIKDHLLEDTKQNAWQLASIQLSGWTSLPILASSIAVLESNSFVGAILTIIVANAILWFIRLAILSMSFTKRLSALDLSRVYFGSFGGYFIAILLLLSTLAWFMAQTTTASHAILSLTPLSSDMDQFTRISVLVGLFSALFCMGGIIALRKLTSYALPFLLAGFATILFLLPDRSLHTNTNLLSLSGLTLLLGTNLGVTSDLPTFFRHSKSWNTSVKALTLIQITSVALGICSLYFGSIILNGLTVDKETVRTVSHLLLKSVLACFIFLSVICANVANVYSASVGWEILAPKQLVGSKEYFLLGIGLTTIFIMISGIFSLDFLLQASDSSLVNLCIVLVLAHIVSKKEPHSFGKGSYFLAWFVSTVVNVLQLAGIVLVGYSTVLVGAVLIFLCTLPSFIHTRIKKLF